jgi:hypothetical protein
MILIMTVCLILAPVQCREEPIDLSLTAPTPHACMVQAQAEMARWHEGHPMHQVREWRCGRPDPGRSA